MRVCWAKCREVIDDLGRHIMPVDLEVYRVRGQVRNLSEGGRRTDPISPLFWRGEDIYFVAWSDIPKSLQITDKEATDAAQANQNDNYLKEVEDQVVLSKAKREEPRTILLEGEEQLPVEEEPKPVPEPKWRNCGKERDQWEDEPKPTITLQQNAVANWGGVTYNTDQTILASDENHFIGTLDHTGGTITIEPGCYIRVDAVSWWNLNGGRVVCNGTENAWITFSGDAGLRYYTRWKWDGATPADGHHQWSYIHFDGVSRHLSGFWYLLSAAGSNYSLSVPQNIFIDGGSETEGAALLRAENANPIAFSIEDLVLLGADPLYWANSFSGTLSDPNSLLSLNRFVVSGIGTYGTDAGNGPCRSYLPFSCKDGVFLNIGDFYFPSTSITFVNAYTFQDCYFLGQAKSSDTIIKFLCYKYNNVASLQRCLFSGLPNPGTSHGMLYFTGSASGPEVGLNLTIKDCDLSGSSCYGLYISTAELSAISVDISLKNNSDYRGFDVDATHPGDQWRDFRAVPVVPTLRSSLHLPPTVNDGIGGASGTLSVVATDANTITVGAAADAGPGGAQGKLQYDVQWRRTVDAAWQTKRIGGNLMVAWYGAIPNIRETQSSADNPETGVMATTLSTTLDGLQDDTEYQVRVISFYDKTNAPDLIGTSDTYTVTTPSGGGGGGASAINPNGVIKTPRFTS